LSPPHAGYRAVLTFNASGSIESYDERRQATLRESIAVLAGLAANDTRVALTITPASVHIEALFALASGLELSAVSENLAGALATPEAASSALGITVESAPALVAFSLGASPQTVLVGSSTAAALSSEDSLGSGATTTVVVAIAVSAAVCLMLCAALWLVRRSNAWSSKRRARTSALGALGNAAPIVISSSIAVPSCVASSVAMPGANTQHEFSTSFCEMQSLPASSVMNEKDDLPVHPTKGPEREREMTHI
jgi:hypothetical protein